MREASPIGSIGVVVAMAAEARVLAPRGVVPDRIVPLGEGAALLLGGMGPAAAHGAAAALADGGARALATFGVAGALAEGVRNGTLFCPDLILGDDGREGIPDPAWRTALLARLAAVSSPVLRTGTLLSISRPPLGAADKTQAGSRYAATAVDMESAAVAAVAKERGLPFLALRAIVDEAGDTVPSALLGGLDAWGRPRRWAFAATLARHPMLLAYLPGLASRMRHALRALHEAADAAGHAFGWSR